MRRQIYAGYEKRLSKDKKLEKNGNNLYSNDNSRKLSNSVVQIDKTDTWQQMARKWSAEREGTYSSELGNKYNDIKGLKRGRSEKQVCYANKH